MSLTKKNNYSVVIVGGGLVGASLAIALKKIGLDLLVLEAVEAESQLQPSFDDRSVALSLSSMKILNKFGIYEKLKYKGQALENIHVSDQGQYGFARLESNKLNIEQLGAVIENRILGELLLDKVEQLKIEYRSPIKVTKATKDDRGYSLLLTNGEHEETVNCSLLILADGARSPLKNDLGFTTKETDFEKSAIVCNVKPQLPHNNWAYERFTSNGPLALLPLNQNRLSIVWSNTVEKTKELINSTEEEFAEELLKSFGARLGWFEKIGKRLSFPLKQIVSINTVKENCLLIGNSAQTLHPIAGQGLNLALRDILALQAHLGSSNLDKLGDYNDLLMFEKTRVKDRQETIANTEGLARLFANEWSPMTYSRNFIMKFMDIIPPLKEKFAIQAMGFKNE